MTAHLSRTLTGALAGNEMGHRDRKTASTSRVPLVSARAAKPTPRVAKVRGGRAHRHTLVHLSLSQEVVDDIDTLLWLRVTAADLEVEAIRGGKHRIYDEAVESFLRKYEQQPCGALTRVGSHGWRTVRVSTPLIDRCKQVAARSGVAVGSVVSCALTMFVQSRVQPAWREFRNAVRVQAKAVLKQK